MKVLHCRDPVPINVDLKTKFEFVTYYLVIFSLISLFSQTRTQTCKTPFGRGFTQLLFHKIYFEFPIIIRLPVDIFA